MTERMVGQIVDRCLNTWLLGTYSAQYNVLDDDIDATVNELSTDLAVGEIGKGSFLAIDDELLYVAERDATNLRLVVVRGVRGTTAAPHAANVPIEVNPRFPRFMVRQMIQEEIDSWPETLYQPKPLAASVAARGGTIDIPATVDDLDVKGVINLRRASLSTLDDRHRRTCGYEVQWDNDTVGEGQIILAESIDIATTFRVLLAVGFNTDDILELGDDCDLVSDVGLTPGMCEIVELGASYRLLMGRASVRLFPEAEGQARLAQEVGARDIPAFASSLLALRQRAESGEIDRLYHRHGFSPS